MEVWRAGRTAPAERARSSGVDVKTQCHYGIGVKLLNVRLNPTDALKVRALRGQGVEISGVVREAIRSEYERRVRIPREADVEQILRSIHEAHPDRPGAGERGFDVHDRKQFRKAMQRHVGRRRR